MFRDIYDVIVVGGGHAGAEAAASAAKLPQSAWAGAARRRRWRSRASRGAPSRRSGRSATR